jgi:hypothetical protein
LTRLGTTRNDLREDRRGIIINIGLVPFIGLIMVALALISWALWGYSIDIGIYAWSWLLVGLGALLLTARMMGMNLWALLLIPTIAAALWYFGVMGGTF